MSMAFFIFAAAKKYSTPYREPPGFFPQRLLHLEAGQVAEITQMAAADKESGNAHVEFFVKATESFGKYTNEKRRDDGTINF